MLFLPEEAQGVRDSWMRLKSGSRQAHSGCLGLTCCMTKPAEEESSMNVRTLDESGPVPILRAFKEGEANL